MSDNEDDYLSDKFLASAALSSVHAPKTYAQLRKEARVQSDLKNEQNKIKGRRQRELEAREKGLAKSLFERAKEEKAAGISTGNKALTMMMKMGFKPGQALGRPIEESTDTDSHEAIQDTTYSSAKQGHATEPIPLNEWAGKKGIGLGKRSRSPTSAERVAKMAKMAKEAEAINQQDFRNRSRQEYDEKRAEGRLVPAQRTCVLLDEQAGKPFHALWLNPNNMDTFPEGLLESIRSVTELPLDRHEEPIQVRLKKQMQADALQPSDDLDVPVSTKEFSPELIEEAIQFLRLHAQNRLQILLGYLRDVHAYCFWCGIRYDDQEALKNQCPGSDEESHD